MTNTVGRESFVDGFVDGLIVVAGLVCVVVLCVLFTFKSLSLLQGHGKFKPWAALSLNLCIEEFLGQLLKISLCWPFTTPPGMSLSECGKGIHS